jgi:acetylornithine aminotransferase
MTLKEQQRLDASYLMQTYKRHPVEFVRGDGMRLFDDTGAEYLDFLAGVGAVSVGHANPRVVSAIQKQAAKLLHVSNYYFVEGRGELAEKLSALLSGEGGAGAAEAEGGQAASPTTPPASAPSAGPWRSFFANSGAEAVEGAIKIARKYGAEHLEGADTILCAWRSFHGRTLAALAATGQDSKKDAFAPLPSGFVHIDLNDTQALKNMLRQGLGGKSVCAVMLECVQGEGGVYPCTEEYLQLARRLTAERDILLILDEVQTGFYRTGPPFAFQQYGIVPDVVALAKGLGAGVPIGVVAARGVAAEVFEPGNHGSTFGGSPLAIAAANATLDELAATDAGTRVARVGAYLQQRLKELPSITEVRGRGLMVGVEFDEPIAEQIVAAGLNAGFVLNNIGRHILRLIPPLVCTEQEVDALVVWLQKTLEQL